MAAATAAVPSQRPVLWIGRCIIGLWLAYLLLAPTVGLNWIGSWHNEQRAAQVVLLIMTATSWLFMMALAPPGSPTRQGFPALVLAFFAVGILSTIANGSAISGFAEVSLIALLVVLAQVAADVVRRDYNRSLKLASAFALIWASAYLLGVTVRYAAALHVGRQPDMDVVLFGYANPRFASALHALLIPFIAYKVADERMGVVLRIGALVILGLLWAANIALGTRAIWFAYAVSLPLMLIFLPRGTAMRLTIAIAAAAIAGVALYYICFESMATAAVTAQPSTLPPLQNMTLTSREVLWSLAWNSMLSAPLLGIGPFQFAALGNPVGAHPHNWILQISAEWGCVGLLIVLYGLVRLATRLRSLRNQDGTDLTVPGMAIGVAVVYGLVDGNLVMPVSQSTFTLVSGMLWGGMQSRATPGEIVTGSSRAIAAGALTIIAASILTAFATNTFAQSERAATGFRLRHPDAWLVPRFWEQDPEIPHSLRGGRRP